VGIARSSSLKRTSRDATFAFGPRAPFSLCPWFRGSTSLTPENGFARFGAASLRLTPCTPESGLDDTLEFEVGRPITSRRRGGSAFLLLLGALDTYPQSYRFAVCSGL
jgi:hypothetical protein